jgi:hypothetical protein
VAVAGGLRTTRWVAGAVMVCGLTVLATVAVHAATGSAAVATAQERASDRAHERLLDCLSARAHRLITPSERVHARGSDLESIIDLEGALAPWATMVVGLAPASATLDLEPGSGPGSCGGYMLRAVPTGHP